MSASTQPSALMAPNSKRTRMTATALPALQDVRDNFRYPNAISAYEICLLFERKALEDAKGKGKGKGKGNGNGKGNGKGKGKGKSKSEAANQDIDQDDVVIRARVLGYLLLNVPSDQALAEVVKVIHSCNAQGDQYNNLYKLGDSFINWFIRPFRKYKGRTPMPSEHPSRPSFNTDRESLMANLKEAPKDHKEAKELALLRDGYRCMVTGKYDMLIQDLDTVSDQEILAAGGAVHTECAHILPDSTYFDVEGAGNGAKAAYAGSVLAVLQRFGYDVKTLNGAKVHSLVNIMTMQKDVHDYFDRLELWFEKTEQENRYRPKAFHTIISLPEVVTFTSTDPRRLPLPSPELLALHATCSKVARMSGAAEYLDNFDRDMDDLGVLASDGTSSAALHHAIWERLGHSIDVGA